MPFSASIQKSKWFGSALGLSIACFVVAALANPAPAAAQFTVCNDNAKAGIMVDISVDETDSSRRVVSSTTSGSTAVAAGVCQALVVSSLFNVSDIFVFVWEPSNITHMWSGNPQDPFQFCVPTVGKDGTAPHFSSHEPVGIKPACGPGQVKVTFMDLEIGFRQSYTQSFQDPIEGQTPQQSNQPAAAPAPAGAASTAAPTSIPKPAPAAVPKPAPAVQSTAGAPTGNAVLTVTSGMPAQAGGANPLSGHTYVLLNQSFEAVLTSAGVQAPAGVSAVKGYLAACANNQPACQAGVAATNSSTVSGARADAGGKAQLPGVPPGTYYFFCLGAYNNQMFKWDFPVQLKAGANSLTLNQQNAVAVN